MCILHYSMPFHWRITLIYSERSECCPGECLRLCGVRLWLCLRLCGVVGPAFVLVVVGGVVPSPLALPWLGGSVRLLAVPSPGWLWVGSALGLALAGWEWVCAFGFAFGLAFPLYISIFIENLDF